MRNVEDIIHEMLRVGKEVVITFPNFGYWKNRLQILQGYMPVSKELPFKWYDTPNVHLCTIHDFDSFCRKNKIKVKERLILTDKKSVSFYPNFFGAFALYKLVSK